VRVSAGIEISSSRRGDAARRHESATDDEDPPCRARVAALRRRLRARRRFERRFERRVERRVPVAAGTKQLSFTIYVPPGVGYESDPAAVTVAVAGGAPTKRDHIAPGVSKIVVPLAARGAAPSARVTMTMGRVIYASNDPHAVPLSVILDSVAPG
jgi:hypothetical protein